MRLSLGDPRIIVGFLGVLSDARRLLKAEHRKLSLIDLQGEAHSG